ncbi:unnamed protein product [Cylindrotheca closterium]|uniref:ATP synthase mitochondrial F1 complex assembly factor 1 n=1 Tax=Cylindrotheca closterium TaxID=2856 RepID=A0AAD2FXA7_9STRA|nr:unnamed protein product [Cylindrotheca closterium]
MISNRFLRTIATKRSHLISTNTTRCFSFSFVGPKELNDILKKDLVGDKPRSEVADLWYSFHEEKDNVHGLVMKGEDASTVLSRAASSPFFIQPVFRDDGYFMLISQFFEPSHFIMAYLEDYKMDPSAAQPLLTFSVFDDYAEEKDLTLVRADVLNKGIEDAEGLKIVKNMLDKYSLEDEYMDVYAFNKKPETFDFDDFISQQNQKWKTDQQTVDGN